MKSICKNCGHPVRSLFWIFFWYHTQENSERAQLTKKCWETSDCGCPYPVPSEIPDDDRHIAQLILLIVILFIIVYYLMM